MDVFGALADPVRRSLLVDLAAAPHRVVDLADTRPISRPAVSKHLRLLLSAGLVTATDSGRERYYALASGGLVPVREYVASLVPARIGSQALDALATEVRRTTRERRRAARPPEDSEETA